ncbi:MAG: transcriptional regulator [Ilumatobacteraceae bacterium]|nr:transcriptional regulator [Ilumatobacteraceae bacterium]
MEDGTSISPRHIEGTTRVTVEETRACEIRDLLDRLADKWSLLLIELLGEGRQRFTELKRRVDGISQRMLTLTLRQLERDGLVTRTVHPVVPPRVDYELTPLGRSLLDAVGLLVSWARAHGEVIMEARLRYDDRSAAIATTPGC